MTNHQINIVKLDELIAEEEATSDYLICKDNLIRLNTLVEARAVVTGDDPMYYTQDKPQSAKDYVD